MPFARECARVMSSNDPKDGDATTNAELNTAGDPPIDPVAPKTKPKNHAGRILEVLRTLVVKRAKTTGDLVLQHGPRLFPLEGSDDKIGLGMLARAYAKAHSGEVATTGALRAAVRAFDRAGAEKVDGPIQATVPKKTRAKSNVVRLVTTGALKAGEIALLKKLIVNVKADGSKTIASIAANVAVILRNHDLWRGCLGWNSFALRIETRRVPPWDKLDAPADTRPGPWSDADDVRLAAWLARTSICGLPPLTPSMQAVEDAVLMAAEAEPFHPVCEYLRSVKWDGVPRIDHFVSRYLGGEDTTYHRAAGAAFLIGAVARVEKPGAKNDTCIVLRGPQGKRKSSALEALAGPEWFSDSRIRIGEKDAFQNLRGVWIWEIGELAGFSKTDIETIKAFFSSRNDHYRPSYGRHAITVPRQTSFAATTNATQYMNDETGGRRFNDVEAKDVKLEDIRNDRDQLWAEAFVRFNEGEKWWLDEALAAPEAEKRFIQDEWESRIARYLSRRSSTTVGSILGDLIFAERDKEGEVKNNLGKWDQRAQNRVVRILRRLGWTLRQVRAGKSRERRYEPPDGWAVTGVTGTDEESGDT